MSLELEVGELKGKFSGMEIRMKSLEDRVELMDKKLDTVIDYISQTKGGWKAIVTLGSLSAAIGALITSALHYLFK